MRFKKSNLILAVLSVTIVVFLFLVIGKFQNLPQDDQKERTHLEEKIKGLEKDLKNNHEAVQKIGKSVAELLQKMMSLKEPPQIKTKSTTETWKKHLSVDLQLSDCQAANKEPSTVDLQMLNVYRQLKFDNPDGGAWKQGWDVQYNMTQFSASNKLKVFVIPHSHNDPGWIKTFEKYYEDQTRHIFNNMVQKLSIDSSRKMIWAEISYLDLWWKESSPEIRKKFQDLVKAGQIEIVTGGWVMNDEANTYYYAMIEQLTTGHEWVKNRLGVIPENGWAIDPFGYSASMAYLLKRSGLENMVIQRVHYAIKKAFAMQKTLEFRWRQTWDPSNTTDMFCHAMPFYSYDIPHTCGPDPKICCQFDFRRMRSVGVGQSPMSCPWKIPPVPITPTNVYAKAQLLLDQYRKKSSLYGTNVLLVSLGDDFRYDTAAEFDQQFINYQKLFDYMNSREDWFVEAKFGTLHDYFQALRESVGKSLAKFPSLSGDFFTYADIDDQYWSGYFTSRPFYKHMGRTLEAYLRSAEILFSMTWSHSQRLGSTNLKWMAEMMSFIVEVRENLGLFQHHDGITGTEKDHVVVDYAKKMVKGIRNSQRVMEQCAHYLLHPEQVQYEAQIDAIHFYIDEQFNKHNQLSSKILVHLDAIHSKKRIVLFNSLASDRIEVITLYVSHPNIQIVNEHGELIPVQLSPVFTTPQSMSEKEFEISFIVTVPPLGMTTYFLQRLEGSIQLNKNLKVAQSTIRSFSDVTGVEPFEADVKNELDPFTIRNNYIEAAFHSSGLLQSITHLQDQKKIDIEIQWIRYGTRSGPSKSGAYLFLPDGEGQQIQPDPNHYIRIVRGLFRSQVEVHLPYVIHKLTIHHSPGVDGTGLNIDNLVNVGSESNFEIAMRLVTNIDSSNAFYSDLNGLQMTRRERWDKLPLQAHFYPMPTMAYIEDQTARVTIITRQPLGVASLQTGHLEVMLDRRLMQDDNRGVGQGVMDNVNPTLNSFRILVEPRISGCKGAVNRPDSYPSLTAHKALHSLLYPVHRLIWGGEQDGNDLHLNFKPALTQNGCDVHLVNLRTMREFSDELSVQNDQVVTPQPSHQIALVLHRLGFDCCFHSFGLNCSTQGGEFSVDRLFPDYFGNHIKATSLTLLHEGPTMDKSFVIALKPMELYTFQLQP